MQTHTTCGVFITSLPHSLSISSTSCPFAVLQDAHKKVSIFSNACWWAQKETDWGSSRGHDEPQSVFAVLKTPKRFKLLFTIACVYNSSMEFLKWIRAERHKRQQARDSLANIVPWPFICYLSVPEIGWPQRLTYDKENYIKNKAGFFRRI